MSKSVVIIGAGLGGLATAARLARAGFRVEVWEKNTTPGGKLKELRANGFRWDTGPSLLTMPHVVRNLFSDCGRNQSEYLTLRRLRSTCRYFWTDGTQIDEDHDFWKRDDVARFLKYARGIYDISGEAYLNHPPSEFWRAFTPANWSKLVHLPKIATFRKLAGVVDSYFDDPHLRQIFYRFATYNGSSPYQTPATFNIIPFVESEFGGWYCDGGMVCLSTALAELAEDCGAEIHYERTATRWDRSSGTVAGQENGKEVTASPDYVVCNGDVLAAAPTVFKDLYTEKNLKRLEQPDLSCSGLILFFGVSKRYRKLQQHNIFFSDDYPAEFEDIFTHKRLPQQPTIYINITARTNHTHAPPDQENFFVLINAPAESSITGSFALKQGSGGDGASYADVVIDRLEAMGLDKLRHNIVVQRAFGPGDFAQRDLTREGSLYGWASHSIGASLFRPPLRSSSDPRVHFVGGTTHPGGGIPLVLLSAKMVVDMIRRKAQL